MDKFEFLTQLRAKLWSLPKEDVERFVEYYREMIDDRIEDGLSEEDAVTDIGDVEQIVKNILADCPTSQPTVKPEKQRNRLRWWEVLLLVLGSPVWVSLAIAAAAVVFSVWISLWSAVISLYATAVALAVSAVGCILAIFFMFDTAGAVAVAIGAAMVCASLAILLFMLSNLAARGMIALTKLTFNGIKRMFARKEQTV